jgi:hypothetical protein
MKTKKQKQRKNKKTTTWVASQLDSSAGGFKTIQLQKFYGQAKN